MSVPSSADSNEEGRLRAELARAHAAIEHARIDAAASEQRRLAQALHDTICQSLGGISLMARATARKLREKCPEAAAELGELGQLLQRATDEVHDLVRWLQPAEFNDAEELVPALKELAQTTTKQVPCELRCSEAIPEFDRYHAAQLYQLGKEAVNYALQHGEATRIVLCLASNERDIVLAIRIDGMRRGHTSSSALISRLELLHHRAGVIGATVTMESIGKRSILSFHVPIRQADGG